MLRKLMKHEFRATGRVMGPLFGLLLIAALAARFSVGVLLESDARFLNLLGGLFTTAFVIAIVGVCVMSLVLMINRFRTNLLGDEGYIMFTLPASVHQQIWSKLIVSAVWFIATGLAVVAAGFILVAQQGFWLEIRRGFAEIFRHLTAYYAFNGTAFLLELLALIFVGCCVLCLEFYAAMAIGHSFANHKVLYSVLSFLGLQFVMQLLSGGILVGTNYDLLAVSLPSDGVLAMHSVMLTVIASTAVFGAVYYVITTMFLKKRLNLEYTRQQILRSPRKAVFPGAAGFPLPRRAR